MKYALIVLALAMGGCVTKSSTTEGDRQVEDQTEKAGIVVQDKIAAAQSALNDGKVGEAKSLLEIGAIAGSDIQKNMAQLRAVHLPPEKPMDYTPENSKTARESSAKDHAGGGWILPTLTVLGALCGIAASFAGMPFLAPIFPALAGKLGKWAMTGSQIITAVRAKAEADGGTIHIQDILGIAKEKNVSAGIQDLVTKHVDAHEEAMGHEFEITLASSPQDVAGAIQPIPKIAT